MSIKIKYRGLDNNPLLVTSKGTFPPVEAKDPPSPPNIGTAAGVALAGQQSELKLALRQREQQRVLGEIRQRVNHLAARIDDLHIPAGDQLLRGQIAVSSQPQNLSVRADEEANQADRHTVRVNWPATGEIILSSRQNPVAPVELADGEHQFTLNVNGVAHELSVKVNNSAEKVDTQEEFLGRLSRVLASVDPELDAQLEYGEKDAYDPAPRSSPMERTVRLALTGPLSEMGPDFYLSQEEDSGLLGAYNLDQVQPRRAASLHLQGAARSQADNELSLDEGHVTGQILDTTQGNAQVEVRREAQVVAQELNQVITEYNSLISYLDSHADLLRPSLKDRLVRPLQDRYRQMPQAGLKGTAQGRIKVGDSFEQMVKFDFGQVQGVLLDDEQGWVPALREKLGQIQSMEEDAFARELDGEDPLNRLKRAFALLDLVEQNIINGYY